MKVFQGGQSSFKGAGERRDYLTLLKPTYNSPRDEVTGYTPIIQVWGQVEPNILKRAESNIKYQADREVSINDTMITIPYYPQIDTSWRVLDPVAGITYTIRLAVDVASLHREMHLACRVVA